MLLKPAGKKISFCNVMSLLRTLCSLRHGWFVSWPRHVRRILRGRHNVDQRPAQHNTQACTQGYSSTGNRIHDCLSKVVLPLSLAVDQMTQQETLCIPSLSLACNAVHTPCLHVQRSLYLSRLVPVSLSMKKCRVF